MKLYADAPARRTRQMLTDAAVAVWIAIWIGLGLAVFHAVKRLGASGKQLEDAGGQLSSSLDNAADQASHVPLVGGSLGAPLRDAGHAAAQVAHAGAVEQSAVARAAFLLGLIIALLPIALVVLRWLPERVRWARTAAATARARDLMDEDLLALRALAHRPLWVLQRVHPSPGAAYAARDPAVIAALAQLELDSLGVHATPTGSGPTSIKP